MTGDLINRQDAKFMVKKIAQQIASQNGTVDDTTYVLKLVYDELEEAPAVDAAPVVHGRWESVDSSYWRWTSSDAVSVSHTTYRCGRCGWGTVVKTNYCPNCGAMMRGKSDEAE